MEGSWACRRRRRPGDHLLSLYDGAVGEVYGYLFARCRNRETAEELTADVFMAAVDSIRRSTVAEVTMAWLIGIARHKLVDHWRRASGAAPPHAVPTNRTRRKTTRGMPSSTCSPPATPASSSAPTTAPC